MVISGSASNLRAWQICCAVRYFYRVLGPIDQAGWISAGVDGTELPLTTIAGGCSLKTAVFLSPVTRSIASEHKVRRAPRIAAIIRRSIEGVTDAAPGYPPRPTKAAFPSAADARIDESGRGCAPSTKASSLSR